MLRTSCNFASLQGQRDWEPGAWLGRWPHLRGRDHFQCSSELRASPRPWPWHLISACLILAVFLSLFIPQALWDVPITEHWMMSWRHGVVKASHLSAHHLQSHMRKASFPSMAWVYLMHCLASYADSKEDLYVVTATHPCSPLQSQTNNKQQQTKTLKLKKKKKITV